ncbi:hypothetical protein COW81_03375 [Candidatus Campbellbacteria bacterium CG22_combo_CG10-13_8_21_14_all_36_13]|uniref:Glycosyl transferase family 1 domain-containing protein n=1 Tax=Candidatus Campbellbacteria bacterium CG22_combo_CG10-13_8_21_14_all_36_13 TaxID=1974529 RepID=A0A2H0DXI6_9BACT|nr:MAG: hypothetical protein COW81_03375 [Candidatus Campbellbacteria bacterium CG22_combo_CG10-13_8_21_14_all_36_13]
MFQQNITKEDSVDAQTKQGLRVLMISTDRKIFEEGSAVRARAIGYAGLLNELHVIVFSTRKHKVSGARFQVSENVFLYPTNSFSRWLYIHDAIKLGHRILGSKSYKLTPNAFVITCQDPFECGLVGSKLSKAFKIPLQVQIHTDFLSPYFKKGFLNKSRLRISRRVIPYADGIRVVSKRIKDSIYGSVYKLKTEPKILPIFVDADVIENTPANFDLRAKYPQFEKIVLIASRLEKEKAVDVAIKAFAKVVKNYPKTGLVIVGDGRERRALELKAKSYKLSANVIFEGWQDDLNSYYKGSDIFLNTSLYEGYGMSLIEASLNRLAIVTTDVGIAGSGGLLVHAQHAMVCQIGRADCIEEYLSRLLSNDVGVHGMGFRCYTRVLEQVSTKEQYYKDIVDGWNDLVKK